MTTITPEAHTNLVESLRTNGGRVTPARVLVMRLLERATGHLAPADIHRALREHFPQMPASTVYRALARLQELGFVHTLNVAGEVHYGAATHAHHHAICTECGRIDEIDHVSLAAITDAVNESIGITPHASAGITIYGFCRTCLSESEAAETLKSHALTTQPDNTNHPCRTADV